MAGGMRYPTVPNTLSDAWELSGGGLWQSALGIVTPSIKGRAVYDIARGEVFAYGEKQPPYVRESWSCYQGIWAQRSPSVQPAASVGFGLAYDPVRQVVVLFGGCNCCSYGLDETWEWDGVDWTLRQPATKPSPRCECSLAFDPITNKVLLFGGVNAALSPSVVGDTWQWDGVDWVQLSPSASPPLSHGHELVTDWANDRVLMFGGVQWLGTSFGKSNATWEWDGVTWSELQPAHRPPATHLPSMTYDEAEGAILLIGGRQDSRQYVNDLWRFQDGDWHRVRVFAPISQNGSVYAAGQDGAWPTLEAEALAEGGHLVTIRSAQEQGDLEHAFGKGDYWIGFHDSQVEGQWEWTSGEPATFTNWDTVNGQPAGGIVENVAFISSYWSGLWHDAAGQSSLAGVLELRAGDYESTDAEALSPQNSPLPLAGHAVSSLAGGGALLFGGASPTGPNYATYELQQGAWSRRYSLLNPTTRSGHGLAYSSGGQQHILFGGQDPTGTKLGDTWAYAAGQWSLVSAVGGPSARSHFAMQYNPIADELWLFGGEDQSGAVLGDLWRWDGAAWSQVHGMTLPTARSGHAMAWDDHRGRMVLFGGRDGNGDLLNDIEEFDGLSWSQPAPAQGRWPRARANHAMVYSPKSRGVIIYGGDHQDGCAGDLWRWDGAAWLRLLYWADAQPAPRTETVLYVDASSGDAHVLGGRCDAGWRDDHWLLHLPVFATSEVIGVGCAGSNGVPTLSIASGEPVLGSTVDFSYTNALMSPVVTPAIVAMGFSDVAYQGIPLPLPLAVIGLPGCSLYHSNDLSFSVGVAPNSAQFTWSLPIPNNAAFLGQEWFVQGLHLEFPGSGPWAAMSNAVGIRVGDR